jgi:hypothetical protein
MMSWRLMARIATNFVIPLLLVFTARQAPAYFDYTNRTGQPTEMNGIKFDDYKEFTKKWHLVTVRYRQDTKEMRITYANDIAWKEMQSPKPVYSDGAAFGKVGLVTDKDPAFPSSEVPSGTKRFQLMLYNKKKYKETQGWGYALFDERGQLFNEEPKAQTAACAACHAIVPDRGYVFSRPMNVDFGANRLDPVRLAADPALSFKIKPIKQFSKTFRGMIATEITSVASLEGPVAKNAFSGTLDEIVPFLIQGLKDQGKTTTLYVNEQNFTIVTPGSTSLTCEAGKSPLRVAIYFKGSKVRDSDICH